MLTEIPPAWLRYGAAAQVGQRASLFQDAAAPAGQVQGLLVTFLSLGKVTADPAQRGLLVEGLGLPDPVAEVTVDARGLVQMPGRARVVTGQSQPAVEVAQGVAPDVSQGVSLAEPVA